MPCDASASRTGQHLLVERLGGDQLDELCAAIGQPVGYADEARKAPSSGGTKLGNGAPVQQRSSRSAASDATRVSEGRLSRSIFITVAARHTSASAIVVYRPS